MTISSTLALAIAMFILAATPGPGILLVTSQTTANGLNAGFFTTLGIVIADITFIFLIGFGLSNISAQLGNAAYAISLFGGLYLLFIGWQATRSSSSNKIETTHNEQTSRQINAIKFLSSGFLITMSNPKAILFYLSFLPAFVDLTNIATIDIIIACTAAVVIGPTMMLYAFLSNKATKLSSEIRHQDIIIHISGYLIILVGFYMIVRSIISLSL